MQTKSLTTALTAMLLISAVPMMASSKGSCSAGSYVDTAAKVGGLASLAYFTGKGAHCAYKYWWKKAPTTQAQLDELRGELNCPNKGLKAEVARLSGNQALVMGTVLGTEGAALAKHQKPTAFGLYGAAASDKAKSEFSSAYESALSAKADKDAADAKAADEKAAKDKAAAAAAAGK